MPDPMKLQHTFPRWGIPGLMVQVGVWSFFDREKRSHQRRHGCFTLKIFHAGYLDKPFPHQTSFQPDPCHSNSVNTRVLANSSGNSHTPCWVTPPGETGSHWTETFIPTITRSTQAASILDSNSGKVSHISLWTLVLCKSLHPWEQRPQVCQSPASP